MRLLFSDEGHEGTIESNLMPFDDFLRSSESKPKPEPPKECPSCGAAVRRFAAQPGLTSTAAFYGENETLA